jgi:hypothetical protein
LQRGAAEWAAPFVFLRLWGDETGCGFMAYRQR